MGKWSFWLSPRQIIIVPVALTFSQYASKLGKIFYDNGYWTDVDNSRDRLKKKIRNAQVNQYNFILVKIFSWAQILVWWGVKTLLKLLWDKIRNQQINAL